MELPSEWIEEIDLAGDGGAIKRIYVAGDEGAAKPEDGQKVHVLYEGRLESDGTVFDKSLDPESAFSFVIGQGSVIKGWDVGIASMTLGERAELILKPEYGYGDSGAGASIPPGATLIFKVELVKIGKGPKAARYCKSDEQIFADAQAEKDKGNEFFKAQKFTEARKLYLSAYENVMKIQNKTKEHHDYRKTLLLNVSVASNKLGDFKITIDKCTEALYIDDKTTKAYYLRAQAKHKLRDFDGALVDIKEAIKLAPGDKALRDEFELIKASKKKEVDAERETAQRLFSQGLYNEKQVPKKATAAAEAASTLPEFKESNPQVYMDIEIGAPEGQEAKKGRVVFELFNEHVPKTAENFRALCTGEQGEQLSYKGMIFHRIIKEFMMQGGDTTNRNGTGGLSIYGRKFDDEGVWLPHTTGGLLSMANSGPNTNGSQFFITYKTTPWLDGKHTVFGRVISGFELCEEAEAAPTESDLPKFGVTCVDCGELKDEEKLTKDQITLTE